MENKECLLKSRVEKSKMCYSSGERKSQTFAEKQKTKSDSTKWRALQVNMKSLPPQLFLLGLILWANSQSTESSPVEPRSIQNQFLSPNHGNHGNGNRSPINCNQTIENPNLPIENGQKENGTKLTSEN